MKTAVFGIGSPFGSDNVGEKVIEKIKSNLKNNPHKNHIQLTYYDRPGLYLLEQMKPFETVHLIDAIMSKKPEGTLYRYEDINLFQVENQLLSSHNMGIAETLTLGKALNCLPQKVIIHAIEIDPNITKITNDSPIFSAYHQLADQVICEIIEKI